MDIGWLSVLTIFTEWNVGDTWITTPCSQFSQFSRSVVSNSLWLHESQHTRPPGPSPTPGHYSNSCPSSQWCHPAISFSVVPFSSCPQSLPASGSFPMSQFFAWGGQSIGASAAASVLPMNTQDWSHLGWTSRISLQSKGLSRVFSNTTRQKHQIFSAQLSSRISLQSKGLSRVFSNTTRQKHQIFSAQLSSQSNFHLTTGKTIALTRQTFVGKVMSLPFNMLSRLVITFL